MVQNVSDTDVAEIVKEEIKITEPSLYKVIFHNDNVTTYQFVIYVLMAIFDKSEGDSIQITISVDTNGYAAVGTYSKEIAEHKVGKTNALSAQHGYPLKLSIEKE